MFDMNHQILHSPDVLDCLASLSSDEIFTPPKVARQMLDLLPEELWSDPEAKFLDPATKSGVFLREIAKRLLKGLESQIPDLQERIDHIYQKQLYGVAITELTDLLTKRSLYCTKYPSGRYSVSQFPKERANGNIYYKNIRHVWKDGRCQYCGASQNEYDRDPELESHAYAFIHRDNPEELFNMRFDVIIGNPPYHLSTGGAGRQAKPIYPLFIEQAIKLNPRYLSMIIPSRWFAGGMGLDGFRDKMLNDKSISVLVDFINAKDCFPQSSISGGVCYFLRERGHDGLCKFVSNRGGKTFEMVRNLSEHGVFIRYNEAVEIIRKIKSIGEPPLSELASPLFPFGLSTDYRGVSTEKDGDLKLHSSEGVSYISRSEVSSGLDLIDVYKVLVSKTSSEHAGEPGSDGRYRVLTSSIKVLEPGEVCTHSYFVIGSFSNKLEAKNLLNYLTTKFVRLLTLISMSSINLSRGVFQYVPQQSWGKIWTDEELYAKYELTEDEIDFIESMIKPMDLEES
jgi:site-specific DNA-methyltransferase (adenine-specific)